MSDEGRRAARPGPVASSARGIALVVIAVVAGFILIGSGFDDDGGSGPVALPSGADVTTTTANGATTTTAAPPLPVEQVRVLVANASATNGAATRFTDQLNALNYATLTPTDADPNRDDTVVFFAEGFEREAVAVATALGVAESAVQPVPVPSPVEVPPGQSAPNVTVLVGTDLASS